MASLNTIIDIKETAQMLDTAVVQWMNAGPPDSIQNKLNEVRGLLQRGIELADAPLRIAIVGEFNSGKTLLLNAMLDSTDIFPCLLQPTTGNVLEVRVNLRPEERAPEIKKATVSFFNRFEIENILEFYLKDLKGQGIEGLPNKLEIDDLEKFEKLLCKKFQDLVALPPKYAIISALEYIVALRCNQALVWREDRHITSLPIDLIAAALTLSGRPDLNKGIQAIYQSMKQMYERGGDPVIEKVTSSNLKAVFPMIRRVMVDVSAWEVPFGIKSTETCSTLAFLDFPGLGAESSSSRDTFLCMSEIRDAHCVLVMFNGSNPGGSGASVMATIFQRLGKLTSDRTIVCVNRFDEFHPLPTGRTVESYYASEEQGTTVGFSTILIPAKNLLPFGKKFKLYICSALCYLFDEKTNRPNWNWGSPKWFGDSKRQAAYTLYKRCQEDFEKLIHEVKQDKAMLQDLVIMKSGLEKYLDGGGIPALRQDIVHFAMERGEKIIREDSLKEIRNAYHILDEIAPTAREAGEKGPINPEISFAAQEFYRMLELAVADTLPNGPSDYKRLKLRSGEKDAPIWELIEQEIAANITSWPEWFAILNQTQTPAKAQKPSAVNKPQKEFSRYKNLKKQGGTVPTEFRAFDERFRNTGKDLTNRTLEAIGKAMLSSLQRFEQNPDYCDSIKHLQSMIHVDSLQSIEEALPLLDVWQPSRLAEESIIPIILERIQDEVEAIENLSCPYDGSKPCFWNLALIIRIQVQLMKTYRDRLSRLVAASESQFQSLFCNEILRAEILPLVRSTLNNPEFLGQVATGEVGVSWENVGQVVRAAVEEVKAADGVAGSTPAPAPKRVIPESDEPDVEETPFEARKQSTAPAKPGAPKPAEAAKPGAPKPAEAAKPGVPPKPVVKQTIKPETLKVTPTVPKDVLVKSGAEASESPAEGFAPDIVDEEENKPKKPHEGGKKSEEDDFEEW